jgi:hypothetical protein
MGNSKKFPDNELPEGQIQTGSYVLACIVFAFAIIPSLFVAGLHYVGVIKWNTTIVEAIVLTVFAILFNPACYATYGVSAFFGVHRHSDSLRRANPHTKLLSFMFWLWLSVPVIAAIAMGIFILDVITMSPAELLEHSADRMTIFVRGITSLCYVLVVAAINVVILRKSGRMWVEKKMSRLRWKVRASPSMRSIGYAMVVAHFFWSLIVFWLAIATF